MPSSAMMIGYSDATMLFWKWLTAWDTLVNHRTSERSTSVVASSVVSLMDAACEVTPPLGYPGIHRRFKRAESAAFPTERGAAALKYYALLHKRDRTGEHLAPIVRPFAPVC